MSEPISAENLIMELEATLLQLKEKIEQRMKLRNACAEAKLTWAAEDHSVCLSILEGMDEFTATNEEQPSNSLQSN